MKFLRSIRIGMKIFAGLSGAMALLLVGLVTWVLWTASGTQWAATTALEWYNSKIPGNISARMSGVLMHELVLNDVAIEQADRRRLVRAKEVRLRADLAALIRGDVHVHALRLHEFEVLGDGAWEDLGPVGADNEDEPPSTEPGLGPAMPWLDVDELQLESGELFFNDPRGEQKFLAIKQLTLNASGDGHNAHADLRGDLHLVQNAILLESVSIKAQWEDPRLIVHAIDLDGNVGSISLNEAELDASTLRWSLEKLSAKIDGGWLAQNSPELAPIGDVQVDVTAPRGKIDGKINTRWGKQIELQSTLRGDWNDTNELTSKLLVQCDPCGTDGGQASLSLHLNANLNEERGTAKLEVNRDATHLEASADLQKGNQLKAMSRWSSPDLSTWMPILREFGVDAEIQGESAGSIECEGSIEPMHLNCKTELSVAEIAPQSRANLRADIELQRDVQIKLEALNLESKGVRVSQTDAPAKFRYAEGELSVDGFALSQANGEGYVRADGLFHPEKESQLRVKIGKLDLSVADAFVPRFALRGVLDAKIDARTQKGRLLVDTDIGCEDLMFRGRRLGKLELHANADENSSRATLYLQRGIFGVIDARVELPTAIQFPEFLPAMTSDKVYGKIEVRKINLQRFERHIPELKLRGRAGVDLELTGTLTEPMLAINLDWTSASVLDIDVGRAELHAKYAGDTADLELGIDGLFSSKVNAEARVPFHLSLATAAANWKREETHSLQIGFSKIDLQSLAKLAKIPIRGELLGNVDVKGTLHHPNVNLKVRGEQLEYGDVAIGTLEAELESAKDQSSLGLHLAGPLAEEVRIDVQVPLVWDILESRERWRSGEAHQLDVRIRNFDLSGLQAFVSQGETGGRLDAHIQVNGNAANPRLNAWLTMNRPRWSTFRADEISGQIRYQQGFASANVRTLRKHAALRVRGVVPLDIDLEQGTAQWNKTRRHELEIDAVGLDQKSLKGLWDAPEGIHGQFAIKANGTRESFRAEANAQAKLTHPDFPPYRIEVDLLGTESGQQIKAKLRDDWAIQTRLEASTRLDIDAILAGKFDAPRTPIDLDLEIPALSLRRIAPLLPAALHDPVGILSSDFHLAGTLGLASLTGKIKLSRGAITVVPLSQRFKDGSLEIVFDDREIHLRKFEFSALRGTSDLTGQLKLRKDGASGALRLKLNRFPIQQGSLPSLRISSDITTKMNIDPSQMDFDVGISDTMIRVLDLTTSGAKSIPENENVVFVDDLGKAERQAASMHELDDEVPTGDPTTVRLAVHLDDPLVIEGPSISTTWRGQLRGEVSPNMAVRGGFRTERGSQFSLLGNQFTIESGNVTLVEELGLEPFVSINANTKVDEIGIEASIQGRISRPDIRLTADNGATESDIFAMLATGTSNLGDVDAAGAVAQAASAVTSLRSSTLQRTASRVGLDSARVSFGESLDDPILTTGKHLNQRVYFESAFRQNAPDDENRVQGLLRIRLSRLWALELFVGDRAVGGVGLWWTKSFDRKSAADEKSAEQSSDRNHAKGEDDD